MPCKVSIVKAGIHCMYLFIYLFTELSRLLWNDT